MASAVSSSFGPLPAEEGAADAGREALQLFRKAGKILEEIQQVTLGGFLGEFWVLMGFWVGFLVGFTVVFGWFLGQGLRGFRGAPPCWPGLKGYFE